MKAKTKLKKANRNGVATKGIGLYDAMTAGDVAAYLQVPESVVIEEATAGRLPGRRLGGEWRFVRMAIVDWLRLDSGVRAGEPATSSFDSPGAAYLDEDPEEIIAAIYRERKKYPVGG